VDYFVWQGEKPKEYHWYFEVFQRRQAEKGGARMVNF